MMKFILYIRLLEKIIDRPIPGLTLLARIRATFKFHFNIAPRINDMMILNIKDIDNIAPGDKLKVVGVNRTIGKINVDYI